MFQLLTQINLESYFFPRTGNENLKSVDKLGTLVSTIASNAIIIAGLILLFFIVAGGIAYISSAGKNNPEGMEKGKKTIMSALIGFIVVFAAYWIVQLIGKITGIDIFN